MVFSDTPSTYIRSKYIIAVILRRSENFAAGHDSVTDIKEHRRLESQWVEILADWDSSKQKQPKLVRAHRVSYNDEF
jgi:hypothetical protein